MFETHVFPEHLQPFFGIGELKADALVTALLVAMDGGQKGLGVLIELGHVLG